MDACAQTQTRRDAHQHIEVERARIAVEQPVQAGAGESEPPGEIGVLQVELGDSCKDGCEGLLAQGEGGISGHAMWLQTPAGSSNASASNV